MSFRLIGGRPTIDIGNSSLEYGLNLKRWLPQGVRVSSATVVADPGLTATDVRVDSPFVTATVTCTPSASNSGRVFKVNFNVTTDEVPARTKTFPLYFRVVRN